MVALRHRDVQNIPDELSLRRCRFLRHNENQRYLEGLSHGVLAPLLRAGKGKRVGGGGGGDVDRHVSDKWIATSCVPLMLSLELRTFFCPADHVSN